MSYAHLIYMSTSQKKGRKAQPQRCVGAHSGGQGACVYAQTHVKLEETFLHQTTTMRPPNVAD